MPHSGLVIRDLTSAPSPEDAFRILAGDEHPFFLDSALRPHRMGRYSILGSDPFQVLTAKGRRVSIRNGRDTSEDTGNPFHALAEILGAFSLPARAEVPFVGGAVGYLSYDLCHFIERLPCTTLDDIGLPDLYLAFHDTALVYDHEEGWAKIVAAELGLPGRGPAEERAGRLAERLSGRPPEVSVSGFREAEIECNFTRDEYLRAVQRAKDYIAAGDIFQVNLSRRFSTARSAPPPSLFLRCRAVNPAPMTAYLGFGDCAVVSASPERFLKVRGRHVETRPIKGTRPRGGSPGEDEALAAELMASEKDGAELAMIVDLERNDLGRVCSYGSVRVTEPRALETFPTVHHIVATVEGDLHGDKRLVDLLHAAFPGGSITGAPKIRAMEIIDELEPTRRSVYTGAIGYLGFDGSMDLSIVIRTFLVNRESVFFQAGGGIVADSDLSAEYDETYHKARALIAAVSG